ncbi:MAG: recombinase family protein [Faecalibacterium sp.]
MNVKSIARSANESMTQDASQYRVLRTAAYIRVSTDTNDQADSYDVQRRYFEKMLDEHQELVSAGIYSDYGLSGTECKDRVGYQRLLRHCKEGKIDRIVTKSISRFNRNTLEFLKALHLLDEYHVTILFEKENIDTAFHNDHLMLIALAASAQEESQSISTNLLWGNQKRTQNGEAVNRIIYGYRYAEEYEILPTGYPIRKVEIVEEEAKVVRRIFEEAAAGSSYIDVARRLNREGIPAPQGRCGKKKGDDDRQAAGRLKEGLYIGWTGQHISRILRLERYCGDVVMGKTYAVDNLTHKRKRNNGEMDKAYIKNHHPPIISRELFERAQCVVERNCARYQQGHGGNRTEHPYSGRLVCCRCGRFFHYAAGSSAKARWKCATAATKNGRQVCMAPPIDESQLTALCRKAAAERFTLQNGEAKIPLDGHFSSVSLYKYEQGVVQEVLQMLQTIQTEDRAEYHRSFLNEAMERHLQEARRLRRRGEMARTEAELLQSSGAEELLRENKADRLIAEAKRYDEEARRHETAAEHLNSQLSQQEKYWKALETDHLWREKAIQWMRKLPEDGSCIQEFLDGMAGEYFKAFFLQIEILSPERCRVHWFDDVWSEVNL